MKKKEYIFPPTIPVICHVYGFDKEYDLMEKATVLFEQIQYQIKRLSRGLVNYEAESWLRVPKTVDNMMVKDYFHELHWTHSGSVSDLVKDGFDGEFWIFSPDYFTDPFTYSTYRGIVTVGWNIDYGNNLFLSKFIARMRINEGIFSDNLAAEKTLAKASDEQWFRSLKNI